MCVRIFPSHEDELVLTIRIGPTRNRLLLVILTHLARAWDYDLFAPRDDVDVPPLPDGPSSVFQQGRLGVTIFALTGYVYCSQAAQTVS